MHLHVNLDVMDHHHAVPASGTASSLIAGVPHLVRCAFAVQYATLKDKRIVVAVDGWEPDSMYPSGHYTRTLGPIGDRETETEARYV